MQMSTTYSTIFLAQAEYARVIDGGDYERWPDFFEDKCLYRVTTAQNHEDGMEAGLIYADSKGMLVDRISALRQANIYEQHRYRHILGQPFILSEADGEASAETSFLVVRIMRTGETTLFATGRYLDRYRVAGGRAKLIERTVVCDSSRIHTLLALPL